MNESTEEKVFLAECQKIYLEKKLPKKTYQIFLGLFNQYKKAAHGIDIQEITAIFQTLFSFIIQQTQHPYPFPPYHEKIQSPFDYYNFGLKFLQPLIDFKNSKVLGLENVKEIVEKLQKKENVILFANHQTEIDPLIIDLLLQDSYPEFGKDIIFVAGERVTTDPAAVPFSLGRNLICIYSKKYIDHPVALKEKKQLHNQQSMKRMSELLSEGGKAIYVAPSGGRDRKNLAGVIEIDPFDPQSIEMFFLMAKRSKKGAHFYPLALATYELLPPPETIQKELEETRPVNFTAVHLAFGAKISMTHFPGSDSLDRHLFRKNRAEYIWNLVKEAYNQLILC